MIIIFFRTIFVYLLIIFALRFTGKRQIGELQPSELVITIMISNIAAIPIEDTGIPMIAAILPILILIAFEVIVSFIGSKSVKFRHMAAGSAKVIIHNGIIDQKQLEDLRLSPGDLMEEMRQAGIFDMNEILFAIMETNGKISFHKKLASRPVTVSMIRSDEMQTGPSLAVVCGGVIIHNALKYVDSNSEQIESIIKSNGCDLCDIFLMTCNNVGNYTIILKENINKGNTENR